MTDRPVAGQVEERSEPLIVEGRRIRGVIPFGVQSRDLGGFREVIEPTALRGANLDDLVCRVDHAGVPLGRFPSTLQMEERSDGAHWSIDPPASRQDIVEAVERGDLRAGSWRMVVAQDHWIGDVRHVDQIRELRDVSIVTNPAYPAAAVELRSHPEEHIMAETAETESTQNTETTGEEVETTEATVEAAGGAEDRSQRGVLRVEDRREEGISEVRVMDQINADIQRVEPGEVRALTDSMSIAPGSYGKVLFDRLRPMAVMMQAITRTIPIGTKTEVWPTVTGDITPTAYAEGATITPADPVFGTVTATPHKIATITQLDNEVIDDSSPAAIGVLTDHLMKVFALKVDRELLEGSGTSPEFTGLKNVAGTQGYAAGTTGATVTFDLLMNALALLDGLVPFERLAIVGHTRNKATLRQLRSVANGDYLWQSAIPAMGLSPSQFYWTSQLSTNETQGTATTCNSIYIFDTANVIYVRRTDPQMILDRSRLFNSDQSEFRCTMRGDLIVPSPNGVVRVTGLTA